MGAVAPVPAAPAPPPAGILSGIRGNDPSPRHWIESALTYGYAHDYRPWLMPRARALAYYGSMLSLGALQRFVAPLLARRFPDGARVRFQGATFVLDPRVPHDLRLALVLDSGRPYEPATLGVIRSMLRPGSVFLDVGANNGFYTVLVSPLVGPSGRVLAFEPNPEAHRRLQRNIEANHLTNVTAHDVGLSDSSSTAALHLRLIDDGGGSLQGSGGRTLEVRLRRGDEVIGSGPVDLIKIDIEGSELEAIRGLSKILDRPLPPALIVEWHPDYAKEELFETLWGRGRLYAIVETPEGTARLLRLEKRGDLRFFCNLLCLPKGVAAPAIPGA